MATENKGKVRSVRQYASMSAYEADTTKGDRDACFVKLTDAEVSALSSGITSAKVAIYDGYATELATKYDGIASFLDSTAYSGMVIHQIGMTIDGGSVIATNKATSAIYYTSTGQNTNGSMTQKAITDALPSTVVAQVISSTDYYDRQVFLNNASGTRVGNIADTVRLYKSTGNNEDGTMTQKAITDALSAMIDDTSTSSLTASWSASKLNTMLGSIEDTLDAIRGV